MFSGGYDTILEKLDRVLRCYGCVQRRSYEDPYLFPYLCLCLVTLNSYDQPASLGMKIRDQEAGWNLETGIMHRSPWTGCF